MTLPTRIKLPTQREKPILFSGSMVRALLDGRKTMTRRVVKPQPNKRAKDAEPVLHGPTFQFFNRHNRNGKHNGGIVVGSAKCPYGGVGDRLWVRESFATTDGMTIRYAATDDIHELRKTKPSIHMPRWASRITLEITGERAERLAKITDADIAAEGVNLTAEDGRPIGTAWYQDRFAEAWDDINGDRLGCGWEANPWVWCIKFKRIDQ